jgi:hypothetical protein
MNSRLSHQLVSGFTVLYFTNGGIELLGEYFRIFPVIYISKPMIPLILLGMYFWISKHRSFVFVGIMVFSALTNLMFIPNTVESLFYGIICFTIHRLFLLYYILNHVKIKYWLAFILATLPLAFIFFYLFAANDVPDNAVAMVFFHNIIAAVFGGIAISVYVMDDNQVHSLLLISILLFLGLQLVIYIEKYYLAEVHSQIMRPLAMLLNVLGFYAFYRFALAAESPNFNRSTFRR